MVTAAIVIMLLRRRLAAALMIMTLPMVLPAAMMLAGSVHWERSASPVVVLGCVVLAWWLVLGAAALVLGRALRIPTAIAAAALTVAAFTVDAALGAPMQPGSLLNSRPIFGLRWYGFGNVTFAAYATNGLLLAGYVAHRLIVGGRPRLALVGVAAIGFGVVICEGWPSMGTDFGGVIALTPAVLWLLFSLSGIRLTGPKLLLIAGSAVLAIGAISFLDWRQGPDRRSHLGNFVQRIIDGDALDVVARKAVASAETIIGPLGIGSLIIGIPLWILIFRYALPLLEQEFTTLRPCLQSILITGILGTLLNDAGISVWLTVTGGGDPQPGLVRGRRGGPRGAGRSPTFAPPAGSVASMADTVDNARRTPNQEQPWAELGLKADEYAKISEILGRRPTSSELAMYSVMWSEHCSYKSSKVHLRRFGELSPETPIGKLLAGIGENAGVIDVGQGYAVTFKIESHNHPSYVEPYQGAATGVGGIVRDILAMGARPIGVMDPLRFGPLHEPDTARVLPGVVAGIGGYGNCLGLPNIGGEVVFDRTYLGNPLVNALCVGVLRHEDLHLAHATGAGNKVILYGAATGGDGIGGASILASENFDSTVRTRTVQAAGGPGRRPVHGEAADRVHARAVRGPADQRHPGLRCGRHLLRHLRAGGGRRRRDAC